MKILILLKFPLYGGGSGTYSRMLAKQLIASGHEVAIVAPDSRAIKGVKLYTVKLPFQAVFETHPEFTRARKYRQLDPKNFLRIYNVFLSKTSAAVEEFQPDVIHVQHESYLTWVASFIKSFYGIPFIVTAHGTGIFNTTLDHRFLILTKQAIKRAEYIVCVSNYIKKWLLKVYGKDLARKTRIIPGGIDLAHYELPIDIREIEKRYELNNQPLILFAGRITKHKGLQYLIEAAKDIPGLIYIIGDGEERERLEKLVAKKNLTNVHFLGYFGKKDTKSLQAFYKRASVVVVPSIWDEPLGLVILEAMAAETPVIASNKGGIPLVVKDGQTGLLIRARSAKAISKAVNTLLSDRALHTKLSQNARKLVLERFAWPVLIKDLERLYERTSKLKKTMPSHIPGILLDVDDIAREKLELTKKLDYASSNDIIES